MQADQFYWSGGSCAAGGYPMAGYAEPQPIADQWMVRPRPGYGNAFGVSLNDPAIRDREDLHREIRRRVEARIHEVEGTHA